MIKWFRRKKDDKALALNAEQELSTIKKMQMLEEANRKLDTLHIERRHESIPVEGPDRRLRMA